MLVMFEFKSVIVRDKKCFIRLSVMDVALRGRCLRFLVVTNVHLVRFLAGVVGYNSIDVVGVLTE